MQLEEAEQPGMEGVKDKQPSVFTFWHAWIPLLSLTGPSVRAEKKKKEISCGVAGLRWFLLPSPYEVHYSIKYALYRICISFL